MNTMKASGFSVAALVLFASLLIGQDVPELERLEGLYTKELERVTKPVRDGYRKALVRLQKTYTTGDRLDDALAVRHEIERLDAELPGTVPKFAKFSDDDEESTTARTGNSELREWKGDGVVTEENGEEILRIKATTEARQIERSFDVEKFRGGMKLKFSYRTTDYTGTGLRLKGYNTPTGHYHRDLPLPNDGQWREYEWPYKSEQYMDARNIRMVLEVQGGAGNVEFKDLEVEEL